MRPPHRSSSGRPSGARPGSAAMSGSDWLVWPCQRTEAPSTGAGRYRTAVVVVADLSPMNLEDRVRPAVDTEPGTVAVHNPAGKRRRRSVEGRKPARAANPSVSTPPAEPAPRMTDPASLRYRR